MEVSVSIDEELLQRAREVAARMGTSVEQLLIAYLEELVGQSYCRESQDAIEEELAELEQLSAPRGRRSNDQGANLTEFLERLKTRDSVDLGESAAIAVTAEREGR